MFHSYNLGIPPTTYMTHCQDKSTLVSPDQYNNHSSTKSDKSFFLLIKKTTFHTNPSINSFFVYIEEQTIMKMYLLELNFNKQEKKEDITK